MTVSCPTPRLSTVISVSGLDYFYPAKQALSDISFDIKAGDITALVGPNGAGKSTLMRCLAALDRPFAGKIEICGIDILEDPRAGHARVGYLSDDFGLYDDLSVKDVLGFMAGCHNLSPEIATESVINRLHLQSVAHQKCGTLSRGWRQRVGIGMSILHKPDLLILDEPASGLDPEARAELSLVLKSLQAEGMSILVSSHILAELEEYSTAMLVLREGKIREHITLDAHRATRAHVRLTVTTLTAVTNEQEPFFRSHDLSGQPSFAQDRTQVTLTTTGDATGHHTILKSLLARDIPVCGFAVEEISLQNLYLDLAKE